MFQSRARNVGSGLAVGETVCNGGALSELAAGFARFSILILGLIFIGNGALLAAEESKEAGTNSVTVQEFERLRADHDLVVLDVRKPEEYTRGHIPGAINIDYNEKEFLEKLAALDKHHSYLVHSRTEQRSAEVSERLARLRFQRVYTLKGGFDAWQEAGKPVEKAGAERPAKN